MLDEGNRIGARLRALRLQAKLSTREVAEQSVQLAQQWGNQELKISPSWLARVEREQHELTASKLVALAHIYRVPAQELLRLFHAERAGNSSPTAPQHSSDCPQSLQVPNYGRESTARPRMKTSQLPLYRVFSPRGNLRFPSRLARVLLRAHSPRSRFFPSIVMVLGNCVRRLPKS